MRVLVVGSSRFDKNDKTAIDAVGQELGERLAKRGHTILVGSDHPDDVDPSIVAGALADPSNKTPIEVHVTHGATEPYQGKDADPDVNLRVIWHQFADWDVTVMEVVRTVDAVLAISGRVGVIQTGISAWMMGVAIIPVGSFDGGAKTLWEYGSSRRAEFYHQGITDADIDRLASPWGTGTADFVVDRLERVAKAANLAKTPRNLLLSELALIIVALMGWIFFLTFPAVFGAADWWKLEYNLPLLFATVSASGLLGASMQTLRSMRSGSIVTGRRIVIDTALGITAGVVVAMLYLLAQAGITGDVTVKMEVSDYIRVALIMSMASLFAALYLDAAFARLDKAGDSVITGKYEEPDSS